MAHDFDSCDYIKPARVSTLLTKVCLNLELSEGFSVKWMIIDFEVKWWFISHCAWWVLVVDVNQKIIGVYFSFQESWNFNFFVQCKKYAVLFFCDLTLKC